MLRKALLMHQARRSELIASVLRSGDRRIEVEVTSILCIAGSALSSEMQWHSCKDTSAAETTTSSEHRGELKTVILISYIYLLEEYVCTHTHVHEHRGQKKHMQELLVLSLYHVCSGSALELRPGSEQAPVLPGLCPALQCELGQTQLLSAWPCSFHCNERPIVSIFIPVDCCVHGFNFK